MSSKMTQMYCMMREDDRLQKNWEQNQPRIDRALESVLIARTPREVATAALLLVKQRYEPAAAGLLCAECDSDLLVFAREQGTGGKQLANLIGRRGEVDPEVVSAAIQSLEFYRDRSRPNTLVRMTWSNEGLLALSRVPVEEVFKPGLRPSWAQRKAAGLCELARLLSQNLKLDDGDLRSCLLAIPGLGPERADAVGVFGFRRGWPIVDEYLWRLLTRHNVLTPEQQKASSYDNRRRAFEPCWRELVNSELAEPDELAATLYLWACEAERFGYSYAIEG